MLSAQEGSLPHRPVLYHEIIHALQPHAGGFYVDCTLGAGGHAKGILLASSPDGQLLGLDVDPIAIDLASEQLAQFGQRVIIRKASYSNLSEQLALVGWHDVDGIVLDLGLSSMQLDSADRGFSFAMDAPLDMRFNPENPTRASDLVNDLDEQALADLIQRYGEERHARQVAKAIVNARPVYTTRQLVDVITRSIPKGQSRESRGRSNRGRERIHPATRTFQALRIAVNRELEALETFLPQAVSALGSQGCLAVISFHSLEDRIVKRYFRNESRDCLCPPHQPICTCGHKALVKEITRRPIRPKAEEVAVNPRSRSARLRVVEKI